MPRGAVAFVVATVTIMLSLFSAGPYLASYANTVDTVHWEGSPLPPCFENAQTCAGHLLGTDEVGRDLLARLIVGARITLGVSLMAVLFQVGIAAGLVLLARRATPMKHVVMRLAEAISCLSSWPFMAIIMVILLSTLDPLSNHGIHSAIIAFWAALLSWPNTFRHTITSWSPRLLVRQAAREWAKIILVLATIDFFGFGIQPPWPSWGNMLANMQVTLQVGWWCAVFPTVCIFLAVLTIEIASRTLFPTKAPIQRML